jgi:hypothetical protein
MLLIITTQFYANGLVVIMCMEIGCFCFFDITDFNSVWVESVGRGRQP